LQPSTSLNAAWPLCGAWPGDRCRRRDPWRG